MAPAELEALRRSITELTAIDEGDQPEPSTFQEEDAEARRVLAILARAGILKHCIPEKFGGAPGALNNASICALRESLAYRSGMADLAFVMQGLGSAAVAQAGSAEQKQTYLPRVGSGDLIAAIGLTEPEAGSDLTAIQTSARKDGDSYILNGDKTLISNAGLAGLTTLWARTSKDPKEGLSVFIVEAGDKGFDTSERLRAMAPHPIGSLSLRECRIPAARRIGREGEGLEIAMGVLGFFRPTVGAAAVGFSRRALDETLAHMKRRRQFRKPLAKLQGLQFMVADMAVEIDAAALLVERAARVIDSGQARTTRESAMAKYKATEVAQKVIDHAVQIRGGMGVIRGSVVERLYRETRALRIYEGASEVQKVIIARELLRDGSGH
jgi:acyl-CoA dehydrogenase